jgi:hypothetical protein
MPSISFVLFSLSSLSSNKFEKCRKEQAAFEDKLPATQ